jgi:hypothetical protein
MQKGKIVKVRVGHEANCSSGMIAMFLLMGGAATYLPLALISAVVQASRLSEKGRENSAKLMYWLVPQLLGLGLTAFGVYFALTSGYGVSGPLLIALIMGVSFAIAVSVGYKLAPRIRYWVCLVVPLITMSGVAIFWGVLLLASL